MSVTKEDEIIHISVSVNPNVNVTTEKVLDEIQSILLDSKEGRTEPWTDF